jgi:hypothetical protein
MKTTYSVLVTHCSLQTFKNFKVPKPDSYYCQRVSCFLMCGALSDERVCRLQLLLPIVSTVTLESENPTSLNLEGQVSSFVSPRNIVVHPLLLPLPPVTRFPFRRLLQLANLR